MFRAMKWIFVSRQSHLKSLIAVELIPHMGINNCGKSSDLALKTLKFLLIHLIAQPLGEEKAQAFTL